MEDDEVTEPRVEVDRHTWDAGVDEAEAREVRGKQSRFRATMAFIVVSLVAMLATFVGFPVVGAFSVMLGVGAVAYAFVAFGLSLAMPRDAPGLDVVRRTVLAGWDLDLDRDQASRLLRGGRVLESHWMVTATEEPDHVVLRHELLKPEPGSPWIFGT